MADVIEMVWGSARPDRKPPHTIPTNCNHPLAKQFAAFGKVCFGFQLSVYAELTTYFQESTKLNE